MMLKRGLSTLVKECSPYAVTTYARPESLVLAKGKGSYLWDTNDKKYVDFTAGIAVTGLGHSHPEISKIIADQANTLMHGSNLYYNEWTLKLSKNLVEKSIQQGMSNASRAFIANSGTEANEAALKFARKVGTSINPNKTELISFQRGFHGRTMGALSVTANPKYQQPFQPLVSNVNDKAEVNNFESLNLINDNTCGVIVEPIQGEGGVYELETEFLKQLRAKCDKHGAMLIFDEIQCGLGRTGKLWAHNNNTSGVNPDILTMAKALGNGFPISATLVSENVEQALKVGDHGTTYGGNPLGCRVADYVLDQVTKPQLLQNVDEMSQLFKQRFDKWQSKYPELITEVRGRGLLLGLQLSKDPSNIVNKARENGLLVITCGTNTLRFVPALNIDKSVVNEGLDILEDCLD